MENLQEIMAEDIRKLKRAENEIQLNTRELMKLIKLSIVRGFIKGKRIYVSCAVRI